MLINFSNHPSDRWDKAQLEAASEYGNIVDEPFPVVPPDASERAIRMMANASILKLTSIMLDQSDGKPSAIHIMGEMTLTYAIVSRLTDHGITCLASTTKRDVTFDKDGNKVAAFQFVQFRKYELY